MPTAKIRRAARYAARPARILPFLPLLIAAVALVVTALAAPAPLGAQDPAPGLTFGVSAGTIVEGFSVSYTVALQTQPTGAVTVRIRSNSRYVDTDRDELSFTADNWNTAQDVTVRSQEGGGGSTATLTHTASGGGYETVTGHIIVIVNTAPKFAAANGVTRISGGYGYSYRMAAQFLTVGEPFRLTLPPATDGDGALNYYLNQTSSSGCYQAPPSGSGGADAPNPATGSFIDFIGTALAPGGDGIPNWMSYTPPGPGDRHGGVISGTPNVAMRPHCFDLYVVDSDNINSSDDRAVLSFQVRVNAPSSDGRLAIIHTMGKRDGSVTTSGSYRIRLAPAHRILSQGETVSVSLSSDNPDVTVTPTAATFSYDSVRGHLPETIYVGVSAAHGADSLPDPARITHTVTRTGRGTQTFIGIINVVDADTPGNAGGDDSAQPTAAPTPSPTPITPAAVTQLYYYGSPRSGSAYGDKERILIMVEFDRPVTATGKVYLDLQVGERLRRAYYFRSTNPQQLRFHYRVQPDDYDADGVSVPAGAITLNAPVVNGDSIRDAKGLAVNLAHPGIAADAARQVHGSAAPQVTPTPTPTPAPLPTHLAPAAVTQLYFYGSPRGGSTYGDNRERILIMVEFDRAVSVTGQPYLDLHIGDQKRRATFFRSVNPHQLRFQYRVQPDDFDTDGVSVPAGAIKLNEGSIRGAYGVAANLAHHGIAADANRKVQGSAARVAPTRRAPAAVTRIYHYEYYASPRLEHPYGDRELIFIMVKFDRAVTLTGQPYLDLQVGEQLRRAAYFRGGGTPLLRFQYRVQSDDYDPDGVSVPAGAIRLNGGSIRDADGVAANLAHRGIGADAAPKVQGSAVVPPTPTPTPTPAPTLTATPSPTPTPHGPAKIWSVYHFGAPRDGRAYSDRERILITVRFACCRYATVTGEPYLDLQVGDQLRRATYFRGTNSMWLRFHYRVQPDDYDADGVSVPAGSINLNGGSIRVVDGAEFDLTHHGIRADVAHQVRGSASVQLTPTRTPTPTPTPEPTLTPSPTPELAPTPTPTGPAAPALTINPARLNLTESAYAAYTVALAAPPAGADTVTVSIAAQRTAPAGSTTVGEDNAGGNGGVTLSPATLTFTSKDWAAPQTVTATAGPDDNVTNDTVILTHTAAGGNYAGITGRLTASVIDAGIGNSYAVNGYTVTVNRANDAPAGITVTLPSTLSSDTTVTIAAPDASVPLSSNDYNLGGDVAGLTVAQIAVAPTPSDGAAICLPVRDALRRSAAAARASLSLLRYHNGAWTPAAGSDDRTTQVCLESVTEFGAFALGYYAPASPPAPTFPLGMPSNLSAYAGAKPGTVVLSWTPGANSDTHFISGYKAAELNDGNAGVAIWEMASGRSSHILTGLKSGTEYVITISAGRVVDGVTEWSSWSDSWVTVTPNYRVH